MKFEIKSCSVEMRDYFVCLLSFQVIELSGGLIYWLGLSFNQYTKLFLIYIMIIKPRIKGFVCITSHPEGCFENIRQQADLASQMKLPVAKDRRKF